MRVPIVIGSTETVEPTGARFRAVCPTCNAPQTLYAAKRKLAVKAFLAVSLWDSEETVEECGACRTCFAPGILEKLEEPPPSESLAQRVAGFLHRTREAAPATAPPAAPAPRAHVRKQNDDDEIDAELAAMKKRLGEG